MRMPGMVVVFVCYEDRIDVPGLEPEACQAPPGFLWRQSAVDQDPAAPASATRQLPLLPLPSEAKRIMPRPRAPA